MAWLNAKPKPNERSNRAKNWDRAKTPTRAQSMAAKKIPLAMPPKPLPHIIDRLVEIGLTEAGGMDAVPLRWSTIRDWSALTCVSIAPWEARLIHQLSIDYLAESRRAENESCPAPWRAEVTQAEIDAELNDLMTVLG